MLDLSLPVDWGGEGVSAGVSSVLLARCIRRRRRRVGAHHCREGRCLSVFSAGPTRRSGRGFPQRHGGDDCKAGGHRAPTSGELPS
jgi:hypothetical protein